MASSSIPTNGRLVNIGSHNLALYSHGPEPRSTKDPVILFISGIASDALNWQAVIRLLAPLSLRSYTYDRSGYHNSEPSPLRPSAENFALELSHLLHAAPIPNPLILVGHSWAGVLIHEYLALALAGPLGSREVEVAGLVLVDANHETAPLVLDVNDPVLWNVMAAGVVDVYAAWGVSAAHKLTRGEWDAFRAAERGERYARAARAEEEEYGLSFEVLRRKGLGERMLLVGDMPVFVIQGTRSRDWRGLYEAGVARGNGTEEEREYVRELIGTVDVKFGNLMREFLKLSTKSELVIAAESGHFVQLAQPEIVVDGVEWVLNSLSSSS